MSIVHFLGVEDFVLTIKKMHGLVEIYIIAKNSLPIGIEVDNLRTNHVFESRNRRPIQAARLRKYPSTRENILTEHPSIYT